MGNRQYYLMRKNEIITAALFDPDGRMLGFSNNLSERQRAIAPPADYTDGRKWLIDWWNNRAVPITRDQIRDFLNTR